MSLVGAPAARYQTAAVGAAGRLIVWGGLDAAFNYLNDGGRYEPSSDTWAAIDTGAAPFARARFAMTAAGDRVILWGGGQGSPSNSGAVYDPVDDLWTPMTLTGAPRGRFAPSVVWTGSEMIVWGGSADFDYSRGQFLESGGRYDPRTNSWSPTATTGAPLARYDAAAVWTGSEMLLWGGSSGSSLNSGGLYVACPADRPPEASAGLDQLLMCDGNLPATVTLDGSASTDPDSTPGTNDDIVGFDWFEDDGLPSQTTLGAGEHLQASLASGVHHVTLRVTDHAGATDDAVVTVTVQGPASCDDCNPCTADAVDPVFGCDHVPTQCDDGLVCTDDSCNVATGCVHANNTAPCDDGNACTVGDTCEGGNCIGAAVPVPSETSGVMVAKSGTDATIAWTLAADATASDVLRGNIGSLPVGLGGSEEVCLANTVATTTTDAFVPPADSGVWYLIRGKNVCGGNGTYGNEGVQGVPGAPRVSTTCP
jgi:hypothetical protein